MNAKLDAAVKELTQVLLESGKNKTSPYDTQAQVVRVEGNIAWVHIPGGVDETPVRLTMNAQAGDIVQVRVSGGNAWLAGNSTSPPTDDTTANKAVNMSMESLLAAESAIKDAIRAADAANRAEDEAQRAQDTADEVGRIADRAEQIATNAQTSADSAHKSANSATYSLSEVERVVDALGWISQHATYTRTTDTEIIDGKWYFAYNQGSYVITSPESNPSQEGLYELDNVDSAISNYIMAHVYLDSLGLHIRMSDSDGSQIVLTGTSIYMLNSNSDIIAEYAGEVVLGDRYGAHIELSPTYGLSFYDTAKQQGESGEPLNRIAYMQQDRLFIRSATLTSNLQVGNFRWVVLEHRTSLKYNPLS